jgi:hypothetical protein
MVDMNNLFTELDIEIPDAIIDSIKPLLPNHIENNIITTELELDNSLFGKELSDFLIYNKCKIEIISIPTNWHSPWQKNKNTIIRIPVEPYDDSIEFLTEATAIDKDTMFINKFKTYKVPYIYKKPYVLNGERYHTVINYGNNIRYCIDIKSTLGYGELLSYFIP